MKDRSSSTVVDGQALSYTYFKELGEREREINFNKHSLNAATRTLRTSPRYEIMMMNLHAYLLQNFPFFDLVVNEVFSCCINPVDVFGRYREDICIFCYSF